MDGMKIVMRSRPRSSSPARDVLLERILQKRYRAFEYEALGLFDQAHELFEAAAELEAQAQELGAPLAISASREAAKKPNTAVYQVATKRPTVDRPKAPHPSRASGERRAPLVIG